MPHAVYPLGMHHVKNYGEVMIVIAYMFVVQLISLKRLGPWAFVAKFHILLIVITSVSKSLFNDIGKIIYFETLDPSTINLFLNVSF